MNNVEAFGKALVVKVPEYNARKAELELLLAELKEECCRAELRTIEGLKVALAKVSVANAGLAHRMVTEVAITRDGFGVCFQDDVVEQLKTLLTDDERELTRELYTLAMEAE